MLTYQTSRNVPKMLMGSVTISMGKVIVFFGKNNLNEQF